MSSQIEQHNLERELAWQRLRERLFAPPDDLSEESDGAIVPSDKPETSKP